MGGQWAQNPCWQDYRSIWGCKHCFAYRAEGELIKEIVYIAYTNLA